MQPASLNRDISPPAKRRCLLKEHDSTAISHNTQNGRSTLQSNGKSTSAAIESGEIVIEHHLEHFIDRFTSVARPHTEAVPRLDMKDFSDLYQRNLHEQGRHFVVHQHDHPVSGVHYDLRLQFSETSAISFAIPYGLPGNPNSVRPNRMAIETRVHNLWNNLIESASHATGSLLIWDTGEYEVLPYRDEVKARHTDDEESDIDVHTTSQVSSESQRLFSSFQDNRIRLRLHGIRLPKDYTISLRLTRDNRHIHKMKQDANRNDVAKKRKRKGRSVPTKQAKAVNSDTEDEVHRSTDEDEVEEDNEDAKDAAAVASDDDEDAAIRANNAYTGASNTIGSIHQRHWFLSLDKEKSGYRRLAGESIWTGNGKPFFVMGRDHEISVVTGRSADQVMEDEGVARFIGRKKWRPVLT